MSGVPVPDCVYEAAAAEAEAVKAAVEAHEVDKLLEEKAHAECVMRAGGRGFHLHCDSDVLPFLPGNIPRISCSAVAALIGKNPYQTPEEALYKMMTEKQTTDSKSMERMFEYIAEKNGYKHPSKIITIACEATKGSLVEAYTVMRHAVLKAASAAELERAFQQGRGDMKRALDATKFREHPELVERIIQHFLGEASCRRGSVQEKRVLDKFEVDSKRAVTQRNTKQKEALVHGCYLLVGRLDGMSEDGSTIVEVKTRTRVRDGSNGSDAAAPPLKDIIQLQCYLWLFAEEGVVRGELVEDFPDGKQLVTPVLPDPKAWAGFHEALIEMVNLYRAIQDGKQGAVEHLIKRAFIDVSTLI